MNSLQGVKHFFPDRKRNRPQEGDIRGNRLQAGLRRPGNRFFLRLLSAGERSAEFIDPHGAGVVEQIVDRALHGETDSVQRSVRPGDPDDSRSPRQGGIQIGNDKPVISPLLAGFREQRKRGAALIDFQREREQHALEYKERSKVHPDPFRGEFRQFRSSGQPHAGADDPVPDPCAQRIHLHAVSVFFHGEFDFPDHGFGQAMGFEIEIRDGEQDQTGRQHSQRPTDPATFATGPEQ